MTDDFDIGKPEREVRSTQRNFLTSRLSMTQLPDTAFLQSNNQFPMDSCQTDHQIDKAYSGTQPACPQLGFQEKLIVTQYEKLAKLEGPTEGPLSS